MMASTVSAGQVLKNFKAITGPELQKLQYACEGSPQIGSIPPGTKLTVFELAANGAFWAKFKFNGRLPGMILKLSGKEIFTYFNLIGPISSRPTAPMDRFIREIERAAKEAGLTAASVTEFLEFSKDTPFPVVKFFINGVGTADQAYQVAGLYFFLRKIGFTTVYIEKAMIAVSKLSPPAFSKLITTLRANKSNIETILKKSGSFANMLAIFVAMVEVINLVAKGEYGQATAALYKSTMGLLIPWTAVIDLLQMMLPADIPRNAYWLRILRACDPVGLGGAAVDTFAFAIAALVDAMKGRAFDDMRLKQLSDRMKTGSTAEFAEFGENVGNAIQDILYSSQDEWWRIQRLAQREFFKWLAIKSLWIVSATPR